MTKTNAYLRVAEDDGARFRPECEFNAGRICSVSVIAVPCPTAADVRAQAAHVRALRAQAFKPRVVSAPVFEPHPSEPQPPTPVLPADAKSDGAVTFSALAEQSPAAPGRITVRRVLEVVADHFGTTLGDLISHRRPQPLTRRRQVAMYVAHKTTGRSLVFIGRRIGDRDHTTVLHGVRVVKGLLDAGDAETIAAVNQIIERLQIAGGAHD
jgi:hypothetical protein